MASSFPVPGLLLSVHVEFEVTPLWWRGPIDPVLGGARVIAALPTADLCVSYRVCEVRLTRRRVLVRLMVPGSATLDEIDQQRVRFRRVLEAAPL